jgi:nucleotide-binding universal stress UspA family protein
LPVAERAASIGVANLAIFLGSRALGDAQGLLMGSVSHKVAHLAECTCVSLK